MMTLFTQIEGLTNSRPLTPVSDDSNDLESITPNHFLIGRANLNLAPCFVGSRDFCSKKHWRQVQFLTDHFWKRFLKEYIPTITTRSKWKENKRRCLKVNDMVLIADHPSPRGRWPLAKITKVFPGKDGQVRVAEVQTLRGNFRRPASKLYLLDI